jgi:hypothetical protein
MGGLSGALNDGNFELLVILLSALKQIAVMLTVDFQKLSVQKGESLKFEDFLHPANFKNETKEKIVAFLCEYFVRCTSKEARWLGLNTNLQPNFGDALLVVTVIVVKSGQEKDGDCLRKCAVDYLRILNIIIIIFIYHKNKINKYEYF